MAKKTVLECDLCSAQIEQGKGASIRVLPNDAKRSPRLADYCDNCASGIPGRSTGRRGRPKAAVAA